MSQAACCTCASLLAAVPRVSSSSEKPLPDDRQLDCCGRTICGACIHRNRRFLTYCPYCQTSNQSFPSSRLRAPPRQGRTEDESETEAVTESEPPPYSAIAQTINLKANTTKPPTPPPPYSSPFSGPQPGRNPNQPRQEKEEKEEATEAQPRYTIHHLRHPPHPSPDSLTSLSLRYGIPAHILRQHNSLPNDADYLLAARHTLLIPTAYINTPSATTSTSTNPHSDTGSTGTTDPSLSPRPVEELWELDHPAPAPQGAGGGGGLAPAASGLTQMVSAPKPPEFSDDTTFEEYRGDFRFYVRSIEPTTSGQILAALTGIMGAWKKKKKAFIRNVDPETFMRPTIANPRWAPSTEALLTFAKQNFGTIRALADSQQEWIRTPEVMRKEKWTTVEEFFLAFQIHLLRVQDRAESEEQKPSDREITRIFIACLPKVVLQAAEAQIGPELYTDPFDTYRIQLARLWYLY
jgi:hypothetical protein